MTSSLAFYRSSSTLQLACRNGHLIFRNKIHRGTHRQNPLLPAARESGHIPPSFSNKAINVVTFPVWPRSQQYHSRCSVPIGHGLSYAIPAVSSPLATISATPYPLFRPHWPRSQLRHTRCLVPIGHDPSYAYPLFRPHWPRSQLYHTRCISLLWPPYQLYHTCCIGPLWPPYQLYHTCCIGPLWPPYQLYHPLTQMSPHWPDTYISDANTPPPVPGLI